MTLHKAVARPGGMPPPQTAELPDGTIVDLRALAATVSDAHLERHPEDLARYGAARAREWCTHDNQHILAWAINDLDLDGQLGWLASVLHARGYPVNNLIDNVATAANVVSAELPTEVSARMRAAARSLAERYG